MDIELQAELRKGWNKILIHLAALAAGKFAADNNIAAAADKLLAAAHKSVALAADNMAVADKD